MATEIFAYDSAVLLRNLGRLRVELSQRAAEAGQQEEAGAEQEEADSGLGDFGEHLPAGAGRPGQGVRLRHRQLLAGRRWPRGLSGGPPRLGGRQD